MFFFDVGLNSINPACSSQVCYDPKLQAARSRCLEARQVQIQHRVLGTVFNLHYCVPHKSFDFAKKVICENDENRILL